MSLAKFKIFRRIAGKIAEKKRQAAVRHLNGARPSETRGILEIGKGLAPQSISKFIANRWVRILQVITFGVEFSQAKANLEVVELSEPQRALLAAARARAEARLRRPDMSAEAFRARIQSNEEWEAQCGSIRAFAGTRRAR